MEKKRKKFWKHFWRGVFGFAPLQYLIAFIISLPIWFIYLTSRVTIKNYDVFLKYRRKPAIFVFWHGRALMLNPIIRIGRMRSYVIASRHTDGRLMARLERLFGQRAVFGSATKGGAAVLRESVKVLQSGKYSMCISPDGPSGPSLRMRPGAIYLAQMTGAPIIPVCYSASRARFLNQWDRFMIAMPFSHITCYVGSPIFVKPDLTPEQFEDVRKMVEDVAYQQLRDMDAEWNLPVVERDLKSGPFKQARREARAAARAAKKAKKGK